MKKRPTLQDVAKIANVSRATAARVVNGDNDLVRPQTRDRVMEVVRQIGYERHAIAGSLRSERTYMIALSIPLFVVALFVEGFWKIPAVLFTVGWIFQFVGHAFEGKPPEFFKDPRFLFVGLRWWFAKVRGKA